MKIIPLVVGSLGVILKQFGNRLKENGVTAEIGQDNNNDNNNNNNQIIP